VRRKERGATKSSEKKKRWSDYRKKEKQRNKEGSIKKRVFAGK